MKEFVENYIEWLLVTVLIPLAGLIYSFGRKSKQVSTNSRAIEEVKNEVFGLNEKLNDFEKDHAFMKGQFDQLLSNQEEIKKLLKK